MPPSSRTPAFDRDAVEARLQDGLQALGQDLPPRTREALVDYLAELARWNAAYNLTALKDPLAMVDRHLVDSLSLRPHLEGRRILDAGTGAGLPGLVLAICEPGRRFVLVDGNGKKVRFLRHVQRVLGLDNIEPIQARLEALDLESPPDALVARALAPLPRLVDWLAPWLDRGAPLLAMKAGLEADEVGGVAAGYSVEVRSLDWPGQEAPRSLAVVRRDAG
ncbi:16S rRNA (guanine(527)-N(7))-methyltransferase RsmG [Wenzhouxiangella sp. XN79A]|uniref:16S rRNA (guanine(527)-N(7))-methyltransferase RsmG n=1 Tax=Wenzhouxiangella sp. XN79A TaxID=2724193 RepID=UPI00144AE876|nr:16S rRNA (guanine(527)-N(7))-methyltransferase RsmG [Wenzhouxiangella sp. XN79A]NKI36197.1 16S rRNA (guanine(527)-N(7))-methyltransferase RsmG [Wenzhouxiangella sp. XN79A]